MSFGDRCDEPVSGNYLDVQVFRILEGRDYKTQIAFVVRQRHDLLGCHGLAKLELNCWIVLSKSQQD